MEKLITAMELAEKMRVTKQTITNWKLEGMPYVTNRPLRFEWEAVKNWLNTRRYKNAYDQVE